MTAADNDNSPKPILIAEVMTAHGIRGLVKLRCYLQDADDLATYNPLASADGKTWDVTLKNRVKDDWIAHIEGIEDRTEAEKLRGLKFYIERDRLPDTEDGEHYYEDLIGCKTISAQGLMLGVVIGVDNFGAGDLLEIQPLTGQSYYLPVAEPFVQNIDTESRLIVIEPHEEFMNE